MNVREAMLAAADDIEARPDIYWYMSVNFGDDCRGACALGHVLTKLGHSGDTYSLSEGSKEYLGLVDYAHFEHKMSDLAPGWRMNARQAAAGLRRLAEEYPS